MSFKLRKSESCPFLLALFKKCFFWSVLTGSVAIEDNDTKYNLCNSTSFLNIMVTFFNKKTRNQIKFDNLFVAVKRSSRVVRDLPVRDLNDRSGNHDYNSQ